MILNKKFELDGKYYITDKETLLVLENIMPSAKKNKDGSAVYAVIILGLQNGIIKQINV